MKNLIKHDICHMICSLTEEYAADVRQFLRNNTKRKSCLLVLQFMKKSRFTSGNVYQHLISGLCVCHHPSEDLFSHWTSLQFIMSYNALLVFLSLTLLIRLMTHLFTKCWQGRCVTLSSLEWFLLGTQLW